MDDGPTKTTGASDSPSVRNFVFFRVWLTREGNGFNTEKAVRGIPMIEDYRLLVAHAPAIPGRLHSTSLVDYKDVPMQHAYYLL